jgi:hypothetical protein
MKFLGNIRADFKAFDRSHPPENTRQAFGPKLEERSFHSRKENSAFVLWILFLAAKYLWLMMAGITRKSQAEDQPRLLSLRDLGLGNHLCSFTPTMYGEKCTDRVG